MMVPFTIIGSPGTARSQFRNYTVATLKATLGYSQDLANFCVKKNIALDSHKIFNILFAKVRITPSEVS